MTDDERDVSQEEFEEKLDELKAKADIPRADLPDFESSMDEKLSDIERRAGMAKAKQEKAYEREAKIVASSQESYRGLGTGLQIAYAILGMPLFGFGVGWLIDRNVGGMLWQGLLCVAGACAGIWYAVFMTNKRQK